MSAPERQSPVRDTKESDDHPPAQEETSTTAGQLQPPSDTTPPLRQEALRDHERRTYKIGKGFPPGPGRENGPAWDNNDAMKTWLEERYPTGTDAGSPYLQFVRASSWHTDPYWLPPLNTPQVLSRLSETEGRRIARERGLLMPDRSLGSAPLYPDVTPAAGATVGPSSIGAPSSTGAQAGPSFAGARAGPTSNGGQRIGYSVRDRGDDDDSDDEDDSEEEEEDDDESSEDEDDSEEGEQEDEDEAEGVEDADADEDEGEIEPVVFDIPASWTRGTRDDTQSGSGPSTDEEEDTDPLGDLVQETISRPLVQDAPGQTDSSKKRKADDAEVATGESKRQKTVGAFQTREADNNEPSVAPSVISSAKRSADDADLDEGSSSPHKRSRRSSEGETTTATASARPTSPLGRSQRAIHERRISPRRSLRQSGSPEGTELDPFRPSSPRAPAGQQEEMVVDSGAAAHQGEPSASSGIDQAPNQVEDLGNAGPVTDPTQDHRTTRQVVRVVIPAQPQPPPPVRPRQRNQRRQPRQTRTAVGGGRRASTVYTRMHLRPDVGRRQHHAPALVHLEMRGRKEVEVPNQP